MPSKSYKKIILVPIGLFILLVLGGCNIVFAQSVTEQLKQNIESHTDKIKQLEAEIKTYEKQIEATGQEAQTLQNAVKLLDINQKKIGTEIKKTETDIKKTNLTLEELNQEINNTQEKILDNTTAISKTLNNIYQSSEKVLIESFLAGKSLTDIFDEYQTNTEFQIQVREQSKQLATYKDDLTDKKTKIENEKKKLISLKTGLGDQNKILDSNKKEKSTLLTVTKNKESEYKKILAERQAEKEKFERELFLFESQLKRNIDPNSFPSSGKGLFAWPLDKVLITQYFGKTVAAKRLYTSGTHNGIDFGTSRGTPVKTVLEGVVEGFGNTDAQKGCYSYGKWVLIKHPNGLSTLYGHLDLIKVATGQTVNIGDVIGYSGNTGYSTGPHLHLTVYASQGVEIQKYSSSNNCKNVTIPIADVNAYLDPMLYF